jgi:antitoxin (DNA-binding transcriptional repressor) of toxin-antitoxin stability system
MQNTIGLKQLREHLESYGKLVQAGHSFVVMKHAKPIFVIGPVDDSEWETVIDFTKFRKKGISAQELLKKLKAIA